MDAQTWHARKKIFQIPLVGFQRWTSSEQDIRQDITADKDFLQNRLMLRTKHSYSKRSYSTSLSAGYNGILFRSTYSTIAIWSWKGQL